MRYPHRWLACLIAFISTPALFAQTASTAPIDPAPALVRSQSSFNSGWRFHRNDPPAMHADLSPAAVRPWVVAGGENFVAIKTLLPKAPQESLAATVDYVQPNFDDSGWAQVDLPHDWAISGPFSQDLPGETGKLPWVGVGWYRKTFEMQGMQPGKQVRLQFDGAMAHALVWCNGSFVGGWPYGYASWQVDLTPHLKVGTNVVAVRLNNPPDSARWYPGSGLYRDVWLIETPPIHVDQWGVHVVTEALEPDEALLDVRVQVRNNTQDPEGLKVQNVSQQLDRTSPEVVVKNEIFLASAEGLPVGEAVAVSGEAMTRVQDGFSARVNTVVRLQKPRLWSLGSRQRYVARTSLFRNGVCIDQMNTVFGIRKAEFRSDGFHLNGTRVPLNGVCMHHDLGALGAAAFPRAIERQLEILKRMGCNAIRTSHNPPSPRLLELCDRMGFLVMDEAFDCWQVAKKPNDYSTLFDDWHERDLRALVRRDRNHPSVVAWSIGNEVGEQWYPEGWRIAHRLAAIVREEDPTRQTTSAYNSKLAGNDGMQKGVDVMGYNYKPWLYKPFRENNPLQPVHGSETASCVSSRGEYFFPVSDDKLQGRANFHVSSYDLSAPEWAFSPDVEWKGIDENPFVAGEFVWTGFDYLGEPTPFNADTTNLLNFTDPAQRDAMKKKLDELGRIPVPSRSSYFGIIDLAGFPKDRYYLYQSRWLPELPMAHILPHWNWPERVGQVTPVHVYTSGDEAELFLNGRLLGVRTRGKFEYRFRWNDVIYEPGELKVVVKKGGKEWATTTKRTTGSAVALRLSPDRVLVKADGEDLCFVTVSVHDTRGDLVPRTHLPVKFRVEGPATIQAVDNGDPTSFEPFQASERKTFNGLALVVLRTKAGQAGAITLIAETDGLAPARTEISAR
ncbi:MAG: beta-galactosidase GalB [Opitutaceae bacterium]|nr:beta-galactosidase GalB [Opitutaceae bacterium]